MQLKAEERNMNTTVLCKHEIDDSRDISINCNACLYILKVFRIKESPQEKELVLFIL